MKLNTYEYNPHGDQANGQMGSLTGPSMQNKWTQQAGTMSGGQNPFAEAIQHTAQAANMRRRPSGPIQSPQGPGAMQSPFLPGQPMPQGPGQNQSPYGGGQGGPSQNQQPERPVDMGDDMIVKFGSGGYDGKAAEYARNPGYEWVTGPAVEAYQLAMRQQGLFNSPNAPHITEWFKQNGYGAGSPLGPSSGGGGGGGNVVGGGGSSGGRTNRVSNPYGPGGGGQGGGGSFSGGTSPVAPGGTPGFDPNAMGDKYLDFLKDKFGTQHGLERDQAAKDLRAQMALGNLQNSGAGVQVMGDMLGDLSARQGQQVGDYMFQGSENAQNRLLDNEKSLRDQYIRKYLGDIGLEGAKYGADAGAGATVSAAGIRADTDRYLGGLGHERGMYGIDAQREGSYLNNQYNMGGLNLDYLRFLYGTAPDNAINNNPIPGGGMIYFGGQ
jgi:hypothetical protein